MSCKCSSLKGGLQASCKCQGSKIKPKGPGGLGWAAAKQPMVVQVAEAKARTKAVQGLREQMRRRSVSPNQSTRVDQRQMQMAGLTGLGEENVSEARWTVEGVSEWTLFLCGGFWTAWQLKHNYAEMIQEMADTCFLSPYCTNGEWKVLLEMLSTARSEENTAEDNYIKCLLKQ